MKMKAEIYKIENVFLEHQRQKRNINIFPENLLFLKGIFFYTRTLN